MERLVPYSDTEEESVTEPLSVELSSRKRKRRPQEWKKNIKKVKHQAGKQYRDRHGKLVPAKKVENLRDCEKFCKLKCARKVSLSERESLLLSFYQLSQNEKYHYLLRTTERCEAKRKTTGKEISRKSFTFRYFLLLREQKIQVCKKFFLGTLAISQKPVYTAHNNKIPMTDIPGKDGRGQYSKASRVSDEQKQAVRDHINSFPRAESHYCRAKTRKEYLETDMNQQIMYELYCEACQRAGIVSVKLSMYRNIFNT